MSKLIFLNLPVSDLPRAVSFYEAMGARKDTRFTDETAACMVMSETIHVMLLTHDKFRQFSPKAIADARTTNEVLICISAESREEVDAQVVKATPNGGRTDPTPADDYGFMYGRSFEDPDGHSWQVMWMDIAAFEAATGRSSQAAA